MRIPRLPALVALALSCALLSVSCVQGAESGQATEPGEAPFSQGPEPTGEAREAAGSKSFPFVVDVRDDGEGDGGGWQKATTTLHFWTHHGLIPTYYWQCPLTIGMPIRSKAEGRISPSRAAFLTAEIETEAAESLLPSQDWQGLGAEFCLELRDAMEQMFRSRHPGLGAKASRL